VPVRGLQRIMVKTMTQSWQQVPHFGLCDEVHMDALIAARDELRAAAAARGLAKLTFLPLLVKAASLALSSFPQLNAQLLGAGGAGGAELELLLRGPHNIGIAMDTPRGLIVPCVKGVQARSVLEVAHELQRLQALAREGKLGEADLSDSTFSLSNVGAIGGTYASPIIPLPNVAIGALGRVAKLPRFASTLPAGSRPPPSFSAFSGAAEDRLVAASVMSVSWSADHRVVDGATLARFSNAFKGFVEAPSSMLAEMR
jgi:2-oxoisovalerate dehydrogenase E2 component (dihydrolipoyl transacylase)